MLSIHAIADALTQGTIDGLGHNVNKLENEMDVTMRLRAACGHDSRSVDGCPNCEAADKIDCLRADASRAKSIIRECQAALYVELTEGWDIDPPLHHVKQAHDRCAAWLATYRSS